MAFLPSWLNLTSWFLSKGQKPAGLPVPNSSKSFWHSEPNKFLIGHRTTEQLPDFADVVIVGSGITGASAARFLCNDDRAKAFKVVMLDAREACWGATGRVSKQLYLLFSPQVPGGVPDPLFFVMYLGRDL